jgi:hypothetical protein
MTSHGLGNISITNNDSYRCDIKEKAESFPSMILNNQPKGVTGSTFIAKTDNSEKPLTNSNLIKVEDQKDKGNSKLLAVKSTNNKRKSIEKSSIVVALKPEISSKLSSRYGGGFMEKSVEGGKPPIQPAGSNYE